MLTKIVAHEDDTVAVGGELAIIGEAGEAPAPAAPAAPAAPVEQPKPAEVPAAQPEPAAELVEAPAPPANAPAAPAAGGGPATPVLMPTLGESVTEGTVTRWLKKVGDSQSTSRWWRCPPTRSTPRSPRRLPAP